MGKSIRKFFENLEFHGNVKFFGDVTIETVGSFAMTGDLVITSGDLTIGATQKLYLDGGGDTYIFESTANVFSIFINGTDKFTLSGSWLRYNATGHFAINVVTAGTATSPTYSWKGDENTGIGKANADIMSLIAGGVSAGQVKATGMLFPLGFQATAQDLVPNNDSQTPSVILPMTVNVDVKAVTSDADDFIVLPLLAGVPAGHTITICNNAGSNFELRTANGSNEKINNVDSDGDQELLMTDTEVVVLRKVSTTDGWTACAYPIGGGVGAAVTPN